MGAPYGNKNAAGKHKKRNIKKAFSRLNVPNVFVPSTQKIFQWNVKYAGLSKQEILKRMKGKR
jgi:hypothetical protein